MPAANQPTGILSQPLARMRNLIAASPAFQAWVGASNSLEALPHVHLLSTTRKPSLPLCLIDLGDGFERVRTTLVNGRPFESSGQIVVYFRDLVAPGADPVDAAYAFTNRLGAVWQDFERLAGKPDRVGITQISLSSPPTRIEADRRQYAGDYFEAAMTCSFQLTP